MEYKLEELVYGGRYHEQFWNEKNNPNATLPNALPNCTTAVYGFCLAENHPVPVAPITNASTWHKHLINGYKAIPFDRTKVKEGDIVEWAEKCHVAKVSGIKDGIIYVNASFYTGEHGRAVYNGAFDTRDVFTSKQELSDFMSEKYPTRFYHNWTLDKESSAVGGEPDFILVLPEQILPTDRDESVNQIETTDSTLRIRRGPSLNDEIIGHVQIGYYNVLDVREATKEDIAQVDGLKCWYKLSDNAWCANITTKFLPAEDYDIVKLVEEYTRKINELVKREAEENNDLKARLKKINELSEGV